MGNPSGHIRRGVPFAPGPVEGPQAPETGPGANGTPRGIWLVRIFHPVCIVFISPPGVELRVLCLYFACFVHVFVLFIDGTYCIYSAFSAPTREETHAGSQCSDRRS